MRRLAILTHRSNQRTRVALVKPGLCMRRGQPVKMRWKKYRQRFEI